MHKLQKLQGQNKGIYRNSKLLGKSPNRNYRNYRVKKNIPLNSLFLPWPRLHTAQRKLHTYRKSKASQKKLQKLQGQKERIYWNSKLLGESPSRNYRNYRVKKSIPLKLFDSPWLKLHTYIENLKAPCGNYRNYRVEWNACIENLNCRESLPLETTETTGLQ